MFKILFTLCLLLMASSQEVRAAESFYLHQPYISARVAGRGMVGTSMTDSYEAMFYNPAGLARFESHDLNLGIQAGGTPSIMNLYSDLSGAGSDPVKLTNALLNDMGNHYATRVQVGGIWVWPSWGIAFIPVDVSVEADIAATAGASVGLLAIQDSTLQFSKAWNLNDDKTMNIGVSPKIVYRAYIDKVVSVFDLAQSTNLLQASDAQEGMTVDFDFGYLWTLPIADSGIFSWLKYAKPTIGVAVRNVLDEGFFGDAHLISKQSVVTTSNLQRRFDVGAKFDLPEFWVFKPRFAIEEHDMGTQYANAIKCSHVGAELFWKAFNWLTGSYSVGVSEGYVSAGVSGQVSIFRLDLATYAEEIGTSGSPNQNRRYIAKMSLDL